MLSWIVISTTITVAFKFQFFLNSFLRDERRFQTFPDTAVSTAEYNQVSNNCLNQKDLNKIISLQGIGLFLSSPLGKISIMQYQSAA